MYILILTIIASYNGAPAVSSVSGFLSYDACDAAAKAWVSQVKTSGRSEETYTVCARVSLTTRETK